MLPAGTSNEQRNLEKVVADAQPDSVIGMLGLTAIKFSGSGDSSWSKACTVAAARAHSTHFLFSMDLSGGLNRFGQFGVKLTGSTRNEIRLKLPGTVRTLFTLAHLDDRAQEQRQSHSIVTHFLFNGYMFHEMMQRGEIEYSNSLNQWIEAIRQVVEPDIPDAVSRLIAAYTNNRERTLVLLGLRASGYGIALPGW